MGDRTWARLYCRREDQAAFETASDMRPERDEPRPEDKFTVLFEEECHPLFENPIAGKPYIYVWGDGIEYGPGEVVCDGTTTSDVESGHSGGYVIYWERRDANLEQLGLHIELRKKVFEMLGMEGWT